LKKSEEMAQAPDPFVLEKLPWEKDAFSKRGISKETIEYHYDKHHGGYVKKLNLLAKDDANLANKTIVEIIKQGKGSPFNLAAQIWNHTFYWNCMSPHERCNKIDNFKTIHQAITKRFKSVDEFQKEFTTRATNHFGSGWVWLVYDANKNSLEIVDGHDAHTPLKDDLICLLTIDVWEHAYYIDYRNDRAAYINTFWKLINWDFVNAKLEATKQ